MTEQQSTPNDDPRERYERTRDDFGCALFAAAEAKQAPTTVARAPRRRRIAIGGAALAGGLAALAIGITLPGGGSPGGGSPGKRQIAIGAAPAVAAVTAIRDALHDRILVREVVSNGPPGDAEHARFRDWTDLATRDQHVKYIEGPMRSEFWNPSVHERIEIQPDEYLAPDGRRVVSVVKDDSIGNMSASTSPIDELDGLLDAARAGKLTVRPGGRPDERVLARVARCFSWNHGGAMECSDGAGVSPKSDSGHWPDAPPEGAESVYSYERWWISRGAQPRMLRYEQGTLDAERSERKAINRSRWTEWKLLPRTQANLALVQPPTFDPAKYLVIKGNNSVVGQSLRAGKVVCKSDRPEFFCDLR